jgi:hypothetical protein
LALAQYLVGVNIVTLHVVYFVYLFLLLLTQGTKRDLQLLLVQLVIILLGPAGRLVCFFGASLFSSGIGLSRCLGSLALPFGEAKVEGEPSANAHASGNVQSLMI